MLGLKLQVSSMCTGGNTDLLNPLTLETRQPKAPFRVFGISRRQESSSERTGCAPGKAANKGLLFVLVGAALIALGW